MFINFDSISLHVTPRSFIKLLGKTLHKFIFIDEMQRGMAEITLIIEKSIKFQLNFN